MPIWAKDRIFFNLLNLIKIEEKKEQKIPFAEEESQMGRAIFPQCCSILPYL